MNISQKVIATLTFAVLLLPALACGGGGSAKATHTTYCPDCRASGQKFANVWKAPTANPEKKCVLAWGEEVEVARTQGVWSQINGPGCSGWITTSLLKPMQ